MHSILEWGISVILMIQTVRTPILDQFFIGVSAIGSEYFYFAALPFICTMVNRKIGIRIALAILVSVMINTLLKTWIAEPRPFILDPSVGVVPETGYGFPSGHTQQAALFWGLVVLYSRRWWVTVLGAIFVGLIGLSRIYLGVHYPTDILGALLIAAFVIYAFELIVKYGQILWLPNRRYLVFGTVLLASIAGCYLAPEKDMISAAGLGSGLIGGLLFSRRELPELSSSFRERFTIAAITAVGLLFAYVGLKFVFPAKDAANYQVFSYIRYFLCGFVLNALPLYLLERFKQHAQLKTATPPKPD